MIKDADIDGEYRYTLLRIWDASLPLVVFIMLNPSTATAVEDDPTIRKCIGFARAWGCGGIYVVNLFALRSTDPKALLKHPFPVGPLNDQYIRLAMQRSPKYVVCAWGSNKAAASREQIVTDLVKSCGMTPMLLRLSSKSRKPEHPLYLPYDLRPVPL